ncbi:MAG: ATP-binding cassette domain-containing protein [Gammaproteobacteria bacterium]|nr:ATP-binding cassette domain-containing protein [Gammaproteobacteria bacterium]
MAFHSVLPVTATDIQIIRKGRTLLQLDSIRFGDNPCVAIIGPNGAGKSLLIRCLAGLQEPDIGQVTWGRDPPDKARQLQVGLLLQRPVLLARSVLDNVLYALKAANIPREQAQARARAALDTAGLGKLVKAHAGVLSGGEQQRLALARALALRPQMLFLDEPTASIDPSSTLPIEQMLKEAISDGMKIVLVSHDLGQVRRLAEEVILLHHGRVLERGQAAEFFTHPRSAEAKAYLNGELLL